MEKSTNQELHRMIVRHRLLGVVISTLLGFSVCVLSAQEIDETDESTLVDHTTTTADSSNDVESEPIEDQFTREFLEELTKDEFSKYMTQKLDQYSKNDQDALYNEYLRRCSDASRSSSSDLCPDIEPTWDNIEQDLAETEQEAEDTDDDQSMPELEEDPVGVRVARPNESTQNVTDPRRNNKPTENKNGSVPTWRNK